jgi:adenine-specific DNA-methyltransferase
LFLKERIEKGDKKTPSSIVLDAGTTKDGTVEIMDLFDGVKVFDYPKPVSLLTRLLKYGAPKGGLVLDFFSGSGTTAHACFVQVIKNVKCNFICVQLPENLDKSIEKAAIDAKKTLKEAVKYLDSIGKKHTICEIGKERIRRAGDKILAEQQAKEKTAADKTDLFESASDKPAAAKPLDVGFRVLKIDDSNMKDVYYSAGEISQQDLVEQISNIKDGRTDMDLLFGCLVDWGVPLSLPIKTETIENLQVYNVNDGDLVACFANDIPEAAIRQIAAAKPLRAVFRDSSFKSDSAKINVTEIFKTISPNTTVKVV